MLKEGSFIHPEAQIGKNVTIHPFCYIDKDVIIGDHCEIGPSANVLKGARIGSHVTIFPGAVISAVPQDLKYKGEETSVLIGDHTTIREYVTVNRGTSQNEKTVVGEHCLVMAYCHVAHDCVIGNHVIMANCVNLAGHVTIDDFPTLEGLVAVQQFVKIGAYSFITGGSLVRKNVPPYVKAGREPLSYVGINSIGMKRRGFSHDLIHDIEEIYRTLFVKGYNISNAIKMIEDEINDSDPKKNIIDFIKSSEKGIMRGLHPTNGSDPSRYQ